MRYAILLSIIFFLLPSNIFASSQNTIGIEVNPSLVELDLDHDDSKLTLNYNNKTGQTIVLTFHISDFRESGTAYSISLLNPKNDQNFSFGLSSWIILDNNSVIIPPYQSINVTAYINKAELPPGGHYGAILATISHKNNPKSILLQQVIATLVFVRSATGKEIEDGRIKNIALDIFFLDFPTTVSFRFENRGNVQLVPYGEIQVRNIFGTLVAKGIINQDSLLVLPQTIRLYKVSILRLQNIILPNIYSLQTNIHYGKKLQNQKDIQYFFSLGDITIEEVILIPITAIIFILICKKLSEKHKR